MLSLDFICFNFSTFFSYYLVYLSVFCTLMNCAGCYPPQKFLQVSTSRKLWYCYQRQLFGDVCSCSINPYLTLFHCGLWFIIKVLLNKKWFLDVVFVYFAKWNKLSKTSELTVNDTTRNGIKSQKQNWESLYTLVILKH